MERWGGSRRNWGKYDQNAVYVNFFFQLKNKVSLHLKRCDVKLRDHIHCGLKHAVLTFLFEISP